ncbi:MAG: Tetratricopeptide repeat protein [Chloroflexi bacterium OLB14]|nr:MAG: Tetratricopeptide repeat protein [Chloroflexi bacterium OLB14]
MDNANIQTGIQYFKAGNKTGALQVFLQVLEREPNNEIAWLWLAACVDEPEQKRDCFHKVLAINPTNTNAQKALAELELQTIVDVKPVLQQGTVLKCPSCGSVMGKPDHTGLVQCGYCGTTITYHPPVEKVERKNIERFLEICKAALDGKNYDEVVQYANKILEVDPKNINAWINKAIATFWLTTGANNRYDEAMEYLLKAEQIDKDYPLISETRDFLTRSQSEWYIHLATQEIKNGAEIANIYTDSYEARKNSQEYYIKAMNNILLASHYDPTNYHNLKFINDLASKVNWIDWSKEVKNKIALFKAVDSLPGVRKQLKENQAKLEKLKTENGLFTGIKIETTTNKIKWLKQRIAEYERIANS